MYKVSYYLTSGGLRFKSFKTLFEATLFSNSQPINSIREIVYYEDVNENKQQNCLSD
jgi:hypothetical protein